MPPLKTLSARILAPGLVVAATLGAAPTAFAAPSCTTTTPTLDQQVTCTYNAGGFTDITVPAGATYVTVTVDGAGGGGGGAAAGGDGGAGGKGARVAAQFDVSALASLRIIVGAAGAGGNSADPGDGGGGGGYSAIYRGTSTDAGDVLVVAGGGGGGGGGDAGAGTITGGDGAAANAAAGGDGLGINPGGGADGSGTGGSSNTAAGATWAAGGAGGAGGDDDGGNGGSGYGGGGEAGVSAGGGGAGGSYADSTYLVGSATFSPSGGGGGTGGTAGTAGTDGFDGSVTITFTAAPITPSTTVDQTPAPILLQVGLLPGEECAPGWDPSWADWAIPTTGGAVCTQTVVYRGNRWVNALHPDIPWTSPWEASSA